MSIARLVLAVAGGGVGLGVVFFGSALHNDWLFRVTTLVMLAASWNLMANAGLISLGHSAFWGVGSYATVLSANAFGLPFGAALLPAILVGALAGTFLAAATGRLRGIFFAISTLALSEGLRVAALMFPDLTGGAVGIFLAGAVRPSHRVLYLTGIVGAAASIAVAYLLSRTRFHYACRGMRSDESAVQMLGVDPRRYRLGVMAVSGAMASCAGGIYACYGSYLEPEVAFNLHYTILSQIATILGGIHTLAGPVVGSFTIVFLSEATRMWPGMQEGWSMLIYGAILLVCILFMPGGIAGSFKDLLKTWSRPRP